MADTAFHEAAELLGEETREMHRAIASLIEELEAVDWYAQRIDATSDPDLARILVHNRDEEKEHAAMTLEWIRRRDPAFDRMLRRFLFTTSPLAEDHAEEDHAEEEAGSGNGARGLAIGSLRSEPQEATR